MFLRFLSAFLLFWLIISPAHAVSLRVIESSSERLVVNQGAGDFAIQLSALRKGSDALKVEDMRGRLRAFIQVRQLLTSIPLDDPDRSVNPGSPGQFDPVGQGERIYWCEPDGTPLAFGDPPAQDGTTQLCSQSDVIEFLDFAVDGSFAITVRTAGDCNQQPSFPACGP